MSLAGFEQNIFALDARTLLLHFYDRLSRIFSSLLLLRNHIIFLEQLRKKSACNFFQRPLVTRACRARAILLVFEKIYSPNCTRNHVITYTNHLTVRFNVLPSEKASSEKYQSIVKLFHTLSHIIKN